MESENKTSMALHELLEEIGNQPRRNKEMHAALISMALKYFKMEEALEEVRYSYDRCQSKGLGNKAIDAWEYATSAARSALNFDPLKI